MEWIITMHSPEYIDYDGYVQEEKTKIFKCPFEFHQDIYYAFKKHRFLRKPKWAIYKGYVLSVWATNIVGVQLDNGWHIDEYNFDRLFTDRESAIEFCLKKNQQSKIKIYNDK